MDGIIFDVDGTLWDSTEVVADSWNQAIAENSDLDRRVTAKELMGLFGKPLEEIMDALFPGLEKEKKDQLAVHCYQYENAVVAKAPCVYYEGMVEGIKELSKRYKLFIVSNCQEGYIEAFLENTGLGEYVTDFTCPGDTGLLKADNIRIIMERNNLKKAVYIGDTQGDANACKDAGIPMIFAGYGFGSVEGEYTTIQSFGELLDMDYDAVL